MIFIFFPFEELAVLIAHELHPVIRVDKPGGSWLVHVLHFILS